MAKAFEELGNKVFWVNFSEEGVTNSIVEAFKEKPDFAFAFNWVYANVLNLKLNDGENLINKLNIPFVSWFWDGICVPTNPAVRFAGLNHLIVACISEDEVEEIKRYLNGEIDADYIKRYWGQYTNALSRMPV